MSNVNAEIKWQGNNDAWFTNNAAVVYPANIVIYHQDGRYKYSDGITALSALPFRGASSGSISLNNSHIFVGNASNVATSVALTLNPSTGTFGLSNTGQLTLPAWDLTTKVTGVLPVANGGTNSATALSNNRLMISASGAIVEHSAQTATRVAFYDTNGLPTGSGGLTYVDATGLFKVGSNVYANSDRISVNAAITGGYTGTVGRYSSRATGATEKIFVAENGGGSTSTPMICAEFRGYSSVAGTRPVYSIYEYGRSYVGTATGTSINLAGKFVHYYGGTGYSTTTDGSGIGVHVASEHYFLTGTTGTNKAIRIDAVGIKIGLMSNVNTANTEAFELGEGFNMKFGTATGTKIGTSASQKIGHFGVTPIVQPNTSVASALFVTGGGGSNLKTDDTFDGYTIAQVVKALRNLGILQ